MSTAVYSFFKLGAKLALKIYCGKTVVHFDEATSYTAPKIIASNHPNSFFDAIVIAVKYPKPIHFLARGDALLVSAGAELKRSCVIAFESGTLGRSVP